MTKCQNILVNLHKPVRYASLNFKRQTPGTIGSVLWPFASSSALDPEHPGIGLYKQAFPSSKNTFIGITAIPKGLLGQPLHNWGEPFEVPYEPRRADYGQQCTEQSKMSRLDVSAQFVVPIKTTSKKAVIRNALVKRIKTTLTLIIVRGACIAKDSKGELTMILNETEDNLKKEWILPGWTYVFFVPLTAYRASYADLVKALRAGLITVYKGGQILEERWRNDSTEPHPSTSTKETKKVNTLHSESRNLSETLPLIDEEPKKPRQSRRSISTKKTKLVNTPHSGSRNLLVDKEPEPRQSRRSTSTKESKAVNTPHSGSRNLLIDKEPKKLRQSRRSTSTKESKIVDAPYSESRNLSETLSLFDEEPEKPTARLSDILRSFETPETDGDWPLSNAEGPHLNTRLSTKVEATDGGVAQQTWRAKSDLGRSQKPVELFRRSTVFTLDPNSTTKPKSR